MRFPQLIPTHKFNVSISLKRLAQLQFIRFISLFHPLARQTTIRIYLRACNKHRQNAWERNYNWFFRKRWKYEIWSWGMRWYLWNNSYGCTEASTMNSYKRFMCKERMLLPLLLKQRARNWLPFSTLRNISSFCAQNILFLAFNKAQSIMQCNIYQFRKKATCFRTSHR